MDLIKAQASIRSLMDANHTYLITISDILGALACWAVRQSPYTCPENLEVVIKKCSNLMKIDYRWEYVGDMHLARFNFRELEDYLEQTLEKIPEFTAWNERKNGRDGLAIVSRYDVPSADDNFIDLGALYSNVTSLILTEAEEFRVFNEKFDAEHEYQEPDEQLRLRTPKEGTVSLSSTERPMIYRFIEFKKAKLDSSSI